MPGTNRRPTRPADAPVRWLILCRQSDTDEQGERSLSLDSQERSLRDAAAEAGVVVVAAVRDADLRGYQDETQRPALAEALERAARGEYDVLAVWDLSRLARKLSLQERVLEQLERHRVRLYSHREPWANATLIRQILGAVAEEQTRTISGHVRRAVRERQRQGHWHGGTPYGYVVVDGRLAIDEERAQWVRSMFERYRDGVPIVGLVRWLNTEGAPRHAARSNTAPWSWQTTRRMLSNAAYTGTITNRMTTGIQVPNAHPAIVSQELFDAVQRRNAEEIVEGSIRSRHGRFGSVETFLGGGRLRCGCGRSMGANRRQLRQSARFLCRTKSEPDRTPSCESRPRSIVVATAERVVRQRLADDLETIRPWREIAPIVRRMVASSQPDHQATRREVERKRAALVAKQSRARDLYISDRIDLVAFDELNEPLRLQIGELDQALVRLPDVDATGTAIRELAAIGRQARDSVMEADTPTMMKILARLEVVASIDTSAPENIRVDYGPAMTELLMICRRALGVA